MRSTATPQIKLVLLGDGTQTNRAKTEANRKCSVVASCAECSVLVKLLC